MVNVYHVYPLDDIFEHKLNGIDCSCHPKIFIETSLWNYQDIKIVTHNSFDGREQFEEIGIA